MNENAEPVRSGWGRVAAVVSVAVFALALLALAFTWPSARGEAAGLSVAVTGEAEMVAGFTGAAEDGLGEVVDLVTVDDRDRAVAGIEKREFIGALVLSHDAPEVLTASAGGQVPAAFMDEMAAQLQADLDAQVYAGVTEALAAAPADADPAAVADRFPDELPTVAVTDAVPHSEGDPNGVGLTTAGIPLTVGALLASILIAFTVTGTLRRLGAVLGLGAGGGLVLTLVLGTWLQIHPGGFGGVWLVLALSLTATGALLVGLHSALGRVGLGIAGALTLFAAMPWAAFAVPHEFLPAGLGHVGQWLVPGATATLTRAVGYFPEADAAGPWWALVCWIALGLALLFVRSGRPTAHSTA